MPFNFATGQMEEGTSPTPATTTPTIPTTPAPVTSTGEFNFATGTYGGSDNVQAAIKNTPAPKQSLLDKYTSASQAIGSKIGDWEKDVASSWWDTMKSTPDKIVNDIKEGAQTMEKGGFINQGIGAIQSGARTAGDAAIALFAPLSAAIGATLQETGGQKLQDSLGQTIADKSGITDQKWFQDFAMSHPNAGDDFNRVLMLAMSGGAGDEEANQKVLDETKKTAENIVSQAKPTEPTPESPNLTGHIVKEPIPTEELKAVADEVKTKAESTESTVSTVTEPTKESVSEPTKGITITPTKEFRTADFNEAEGTPQTKETDAKLHDQIVNHPDEPMAGNGESFNTFAKRVLSKAKDVVSTNENDAILTHNSAYGLIKLWDEWGRPENLNEEFRKEYVNQDNKNGTGSSYELKGEKSSTYLVRHGETEDNAAKVYRTPDATLTDKGKEQAAEVGDELKDKGITKIYSSDLPRTMETSKIITNKLGGEEKTIVSTPKSRETAVNKPVESKGETVESKSSAIEAISKSLDAKEAEEFKNDTSHEKADTKAIAAKAFQFVKDNPDAVNDILDGKEDPPKGLTKQSISTANLQMKLDAFRAETGSWDDYIEAQKKDVLLGTRSAQELQARAGRYDKDDPTGWIAKAQDALEGDKIKFKKSRDAEITKRAKAMKDYVSKAKVKLLDYDKIIDSITC